VQEGGAHLSQNLRPSGNGHVQPTYIAIFAAGKVTLSSTGTIFAIIDAIPPRLIRGPMFAVLHRKYGAQMDLKHLARHGQPAIDQDYWDDKLTN
jgi:hypothetical protein